MDGKAWQGRTVGGFLIVRHVGPGFGGELFDAEQTGRGRAALLKLVDPAVAAGAGFRERFAHDTDILRGFLHPHVVTLYDAGADAGTWYVAMRPVRGRTLADVIGTGGALEHQRASALISDAAAGLDEAHGHGLVHRALSPASILVGEYDGRERAWVTDFAVGDDTEEYGGMFATPSGTAPPPIDYVSPEQVRGEQATEASDVYALGAILFHALTGRPLFADLPEAARLEAHLHGDVPSASALVRHLPTPFDVILGRALAKDPSRRFASAAEMADAAPSKGRVLSAWRSMLAAGTMAAPVAREAADEPEPDEEEAAVQPEVAEEPAAAQEEPESADEQPEAAKEQPEAEEEPGPEEEQSEAGEEQSEAGEEEREAGEQPEAEEEPDAEEAVAADASGGGGGQEGDGGDDQGDGRDDEGDGGREDGEEDGDAGPPVLEHVAPSDEDEDGHRARPLAIAAAILLLLGSGAGILALAGVFEGEDEGSPGSAVAVPATRTDSTTEPAATPEPETTSETQTLPEEDEPAPSTERRSPRSRSPRLRTWPAGRSAHTAVIYASATDRATAVSRARRAARLGVRAGVVRSTDFANVVPGVWVAFASISDSPAVAERTLERVRRAGIAARPYVRYLEHR